MDDKKKYKEALQKAKDALLDGTISSNTIAYLQDIFPELKGSDDERIRKSIICGMNALKEQGKETFATIPINDCIAWLEKQGNKNIQVTLPTFTFEDVLALECSMKTAKITKGGDKLYEMLVRLYDKIHNAYLLEKQGEQKPAVVDFNAKDWYVSKVDGKIHDMTYNPADKVEPKFKVGDWINGYYTNYKVTAISNKGYVVEDTDGNKMNILFENEKFHNLWTIQDAKDGDVVFDKSDGTIGIFQSIGHHPDGGSYNDPSYCFLHCRYDDGYFFADFEDGNMMTSDDVIPATKEQRDTLMKAMADAGWKFDFDKKELKKIEDEIEIPFGAKDSKLQESTYYIPDGFHAEIDGDKVVIKKGEKSAAWSDEDEEYLQDCIGAIWAADYYLYEDKRKMVVWLKSIKNRIGG